MELAVSAHKTGRKHARTSAGTEALLREHISFLMSRDRTCHPTANETGDLSFYLVGGFCVDARGNVRKRFRARFCSVAGSKMH